MFFKMLVILISLFAFVNCGPATESYKGQYCTDPRTMRKHAAYTEWADAYSCTRHRCQPGGRNLAIYTVGCKRVEAPESAIECEEVVEDTNMQFPYCCTRLRCLVVVRGEVWTRVLGQPWETLPAAPWSHMYKMKKPPPGDTDFVQKIPEQGPVYELSEPEEENKILRSSAQATTVPPAVKGSKTNAAPDIVIALTTNNDQQFKSDFDRQSRSKKTFPSNAFIEDEGEDPGVENEDQQPTTERVENSIEDRYYENYKVTKKPNSNTIPHSWTEVPSQWYLRADSATEIEKEAFHPDLIEEKTEVKSTKLQALVNAIGTRMRDIETVVQRMSEKVHETKPNEELSSEKRQTIEDDLSPHEKEIDGKKKSNNDAEYKRFSKKSNKYIRSTDVTTDAPLFIEDTNLNGYFSDASNSVLRRNNKDVQTYMAPVETRRKNTHILDSSIDIENSRHKKHHKKRKGKHTHKKHHKVKKNHPLSGETEKNVVSLEDNSAVK